MNNPEIELTEDGVRCSIREARTIVVKVGSSSLTSASGQLDVQKLRALVTAISHAQMQGARIVLVSSGAIAAGFGLLGFNERPKDVPTQQATASVGKVAYGSIRSCIFAIWFQSRANASYGGRYYFAVALPKCATHNATFA